MHHGLRTSLFIIPYSLSLNSLTSCSIQKQISRSANEVVLTNKALTTAHIGISIFEPATNKYWYEYQGDHYFVPASNTKIPTCYAAMKYLGDSLVGLRYKVLDADKSKPKLIIIQGTGDPTFLHPDFKYHPVAEFIKSNRSSAIARTIPVWHTTSLGSGWSWNDYAESYMAERSSFPIYGNVARFQYRSNRVISTPSFFMKVEPDATDQPILNDEMLSKKFTIKRDIGTNRFFWSPAKQDFNEATMPFVTNEATIGSLLYDTLEISNGILMGDNPTKNDLKIHSQPTDSVLKIMMHRSDNFYAEQSLIMISNELLEYIDDSEIRDTILKTDFKDLPQKPRWADGSGLSRYNLFTPQDFVFILNKMKNEFGMERIKVIFPTGGEGTISNYYKADSGYIYGKTGTLSGVVAFSGYLTTKKGKQLIFSTLINNHQASATDIRRAVEKFLLGIRARY